MKLQVLFEDNECKHSDIRSQDFVAIRYNTYYGDSRLKIIQVLP